MYFYNFSLLILFMFLSISVFAKDIPVKKERLVYISKDTETKKIKDNAEIIITKKGGHFHWFEKREYENKDYETFNVDFEKGTFRPITYKRIIKKGDSIKNINIYLKKDAITAVITGPDNEEETQSISIPGKKYIFEPFLKRYVSGRIKKGNKTGNVQIVTVFNGSLTDFNVQWNVIGKEKISTPAGTFNCYKANMGSSSWFIQIIAPPPICWFNSAGNCNIVRINGKLTRFSEEKITELVRYSLD